MLPHAETRDTKLNAFPMIFVPLMTPPSIALGSLEPLVLRGPTAEQMVHQLLIFVRSLLGLYAHILAGRLGAFGITLPLLSPRFGSFAFFATADFVGNVFIFTVGFRWPCEASFLLTGFPPSTRFAA